MLEFHIDKSELDRLVEKLEQSPQVLKQAKRQAIEAAAPKLKAVVDAQIGGSGKVRSWQGSYVGSRFGYVAVWPLADTFTEPTKKKRNRYAVGYVTNAVNNGHKFPPPSGRKGYEPKIRSGKMTVTGREFYQRAQVQGEKVAQEAVNEIVQALTTHLGGWA